MFQIHNVLFKEILLKSLYLRTYLLIFFVKLLLYVLWINYYTLIYILLLLNVTLPYILVHIYLLTHTFKLQIGIISVFVNVKSFKHISDCTIALFCLVFFLSAV